MKLWIVRTPGDEIYFPVAGIRLEHAELRALVIIAHAYPGTNGAGLTLAPVEHINRYDYEWRDSLVEAACNWRDAFIEKAPYDGGLKDEVCNWCDETIGSVGSDDSAGYNDCNGGAARN